MSANILHTPPPPYHMLFTTPFVESSHNQRMKLRGRTKCKHIFCIHSKKCLIHPPQQMFASHTHNKLWISFPNQFLHAIHTKFKLWISFPNQFLHAIHTQFIQLSRYEHNSWTFLWLPSANKIKCQAISSCDIWGNMNIKVLGENMQWNMKKDKRSLLLPREHWNDTWNSPTGLWH